VRSEHERITGTIRALLRNGGSDYVEVIMGLRQNTHYFTSSSEEKEILEKATSDDASLSAMALDVAVYRHSKTILNAIAKELETAGEHSGYLLFKTMTGVSVDLRMELKKKTKIEDLSQWIYFNARRIGRKITDDEINPESTPLGISLSAFAALTDNRLPRELTTGEDELLDRVSRRPLENAVMAALGTLTRREQAVLCLKFGLDDGIERTDAEIGEMFDISHTMVQRIRDKAIRKLRHPSRSHALKPYYDEYWEIKPHKKKPKGGNPSEEAKAESGA
jgi:DNA-binding CsgD family transcriptional regulator